MAGSNVDASVWSGVWPDLIKGVPAAIVALVVGCIAAYIAWQQYRVNHAKFKLDLFHKRQDIYLSLAVMLSKIAAGAELADTDAPIFRGQVAGASFLFGTDISKLVEKVGNIAAKPSRLREGYKQWAGETLASLPQKFMPYMNLSDW